MTPRITTNQRMPRSIIGLTNGVCSLAGTHSATRSSSTAKEGLLLQIRHAQG